MEQQETKQLELIPKKSRRRLTYEDKRYIYKYFTDQFIRDGRAIMPTTKACITPPGFEEPIGYTALIRLFKAWCEDNDKKPVYNRKRPEVKRSLWSKITGFFRR